MKRVTVWSDEEAVTFLTFIHETNRNVTFPSCFPNFCQLFDLRMELSL